MMDILEGNERDVSKDLDMDQYASNEMLIQTNTRAGIESGTMSMLASAENFEDANMKAKVKVNSFYPGASQASVAMFVDANSEENSETGGTRSAQLLQNAQASEPLREEDNGIEESKSQFLPAISQKGSN